ncbi:MAG: response regulator [Pseudomonas sp.]|uniref:response regulator n=1 Tax=Pseudomonas sp. TaxID=306 RepID=UPI003391D931
MSQASGKIILVVEDEAIFLQILVEYLDGEGYRVLQAGSAQEAFAILASKPQLDLLITDFRLPDGVTGVMIAEPALKLRPDLKIIYMSGEPEAIFASGTPTIALAPILAKPFTLRRLHSQIQSMLS